MQDFTYGDLAEEMSLINRAFIEVYADGDADGRAFTFPIPTYNITKDFDWDGPNVDALFAMTARYGLPYFQNFINSDLDPHMIRSMCCRLQLDLTELLKRGNGRADRIDRRRHDQLCPPRIPPPRRPAGGSRPTR